MRPAVTVELLNEFMAQFAPRAKSNGNVYFSGGATLLLLGIRAQTIDVNINLDPEPEGAFEAIAHLKNKLSLNVELASPADFVPVASNWRDRSPFIASHGGIQFFHFDLRAQIVSKISRSLGKDLDDARALMASAALSPDDLAAYYSTIEPMLLRYPAINPETLSKKNKGVH